MLIKREVHSNDYFNCEHVAECLFVDGIALVTLVTGARFNVSDPQSVVYLQSKQLPPPKQSAKRKRKTNG